MNTKKTNPLRNYQFFLAGLGVLCLVAIGANLMVRQGPVHDAQAVEDLRSITESINAAAQNGAGLPQSLAEVKGLSTDTRRRLKDYEYKKTSSVSYFVCARFQAASEGDDRAYSPLGTDDPGTHGQGRQCFSYVLPNYSGVRPLPLSR